MPVTLETECRNVGWLVFSFAFAMLVEAFAAPGNPEQSGSARQLLVLIAIGHVGGKFTIHT